MNTQLLKRLYNIYSPSGKEQEMIKFLSAYIRTLPGRVALTQDRYGNLYAVKGESDTYPCLVSHIDQVAHCNRSKDFRAVETRDIIFGFSPGKKRFENLGADDKNGIFICLECLKNTMRSKSYFSGKRKQDAGAVRKRTCLFLTMCALSSSRTGRDIPT